MPFGGYESFESCVIGLSGGPMSEEQARKICGAAQARAGGDSAAWLALSDDDRAKLTDHARVHGTPGHKRTIRVDFVAPIHCDPERKDGILARPDPATGFLHVDGHLTCVGVFDYRDDDGNEWGELRTPAEVFDAKSLASFRGVVVTNEHPDEFVNTRNVREVQVGHVGTNVRQASDDHFVRASVIITDAHTIIDIQSGKKQLSCGYTAELVDDVGELGGKSHTQRQTNIRGNHLAIVDVGRAGPDCALIKRGDGAAFTTEATMAATKKTDKKAETKKVATDDKPKTFTDIANAMLADLKKTDGVKRSDNAAEIATAVVELLGMAIKTGNEMIIKGALLSAGEMLATPAEPPAPPELDQEEPPLEEEEEEPALDAEEEEKEEPEEESADSNAALRAKVDALEANQAHNIKRAKDQAIARVKLEATAKSIDPDINPDKKSDAALMREVVLVVSPELKDRLDANKKSAGYLRASFDAAVELHASREEHGDNLLSIVRDVHVENEDDDPDKSYRDFIARRDARSAGKAV